MLQALQEVKGREVAIVEMQKRIAEGEGRLKQQQALYEAVRSDRNLYSKNLIEAQVRVALWAGGGWECVRERGWCVQHGRRVILG